nr:hypothetical protein [uncultured Massilia sp.]
MAPDHLISLDELKTLAAASGAVRQACACALDGYRGWARIPPDFPQAQMRTVGTLMADPYAEPTYAEYHPHGTNYWSPEAPIALRHFPYNRCAVQQCTVCGRAALTYVEAGGYYVEPRLRALDAALIVDMPAPD